MRFLQSRPHPFRIPADIRPTKFRAMTLVEVMIAMAVMAMFLIGFLSTSLQTRRSAEASVMQAAATSLVYGLVEQMKMLPYETEMPTTPDTANATQIAAEIGYDAYPTPAKSTPYIYVRLNQDQVTVLNCVNNTSPDPSAFSGPKVTPTTTSYLDPAKENKIGPIALSTTTGTRSQPLTLSVWVWIDNISDTPGILGSPGVHHDITYAKCVTVVYAYDYQDGNGKKTVIKREVIVRTPFAPLKKSL